MKLKASNFGYKKIAILFTIIIVLCIAVSIVVLRLRHNSRWDYVQGNFPESVTGFSVTGRRLQTLLNEDYHHLSAQSVSGRYDFVFHLDEGNDISNFHLSHSNSGGKVRFMIDEWYNITTIDLTDGFDGHIDLSGFVCETITFTIQYEAAINVNTIFRWD